MDNGLLIISIIMGTILFIIGVMIYQKAKIMKIIRDKYGKVNEEKNDERFFDSISQYYKCYKPDKSVDLDDQTWHDLQLNEMYNKFDHTISSIGGEYLYRHLRIQKHDNLDRMEEHIAYFSDNEKIREKLQYGFYQIKKDEDNQLINHIKNPNLFYKISIFKIILLTLISLIPIPLYYFGNKYNGNDGNAIILYFKRPASYGVTVQVSGFMDGHSPTTLDRIRNEDGTPMDYPRWDNNNGMTAIKVLRPNIS